MKKRTVGVLFALCLMMLTACGRQDTDGDGIIGNDPVVDDFDNDDYSDNSSVTENDYPDDDATGNTEGIGTQSGRAVRDAADGVGNAIEDIGNGADNVMRDVGSGVSNSVNNMMR